MPATPMDLATAILKAIEKTSEMVAIIMSGAEVRKLKYRVESGMEYVHVDAKEGEYKDISDDRQNKLKLHFRKRIFDV